MQIPFNEFEQHIDETILKRGYQYFKKGLVNEPMEIGNNEFEAIVEGTEEYTVNLTIKNDIITNHRCNCPYNLGPFCKHEVALLFFLQKDTLDLTTSVKKKSKSTEKKTPEKPIYVQIDEILEKVLPQRLRKFLIDHSLKNDNFQRIFLAEFAYLVMDENKAMYAKKVKAILKAFSHKGYIGYSEAYKVGNAVSELLQSAENHLVAGNYSSAFYISCAVLEEMTKAFDFADDSNGDIGQCVEFAQEILFSIAKSKIPANLRKELLDYCMDAFEKESFKGWDWHFEMLNLAIELAENKEEVKKIHTLLDSIKPTKDSWDWNFKQAQKIRASLIEKFDGKDAVAEFLEGNIENSDFRKKIIEKAITDNNYTKAIQLCEDGIRIDEKNAPGFANDWREYLLKIYQLQKDKENTLKLARYLFLYSIREKKPLFELIKSFIEPDNWEKYLDALITEKMGNRKWIDEVFITQIYIWEEKWDKLFDIVKKTASLYNLDNYEKYLIKDYKDEIADLYKSSILQYVENNVGRSHYKTACRYIRKLRKMGKSEHVEFIVNQLKTRYPMRKALLEELAKV